jgi:hypothetical protein
MSERNRKHMRAAPTLTQIDAQARLTSTERCRDDAGSLD